MNPRQRQGMRKHQLGGIAWPRATKNESGFVAYRELDEKLDLTSIAEHLKDTRWGKNTQHSLTALLRQSVYSRLAGYEDTNDAERLRVDPAMRYIVGGRAKDRLAASSSEIGRFETEILTKRQNLATLKNLPGLWVGKTRQSKQKELILDMDSSVSPVHGNQEGSAYNGHFGCDCYHPLFCFNQDGDVEYALLREGNVHSAHDWKSVLEPVVKRYRWRRVRRYFRADAAFSNPELYQYLEEKNFLYAIRLKGNAILHDMISHLLTRPRGRPSIKPLVRYHSFRYQANSWKKPRRVVAKVEWHAGELFPRIGFIVTNLHWKSSNVVKLYNGRGTAEQWIKEGKYALNWTRLSCSSFAANQVRFQLFLLAYNLSNFLRRIALPYRVREWSLTTLKEKLVKIGAKVVWHARYVTFQMAEVAVPHVLMKEILNRIRAFRVWKGATQPG